MKAGQQIADGSDICAAEDQVFGNPGEQSGLGVSAGLTVLPPRAILDRKDMAAFFQVCERTIKRWVADGELPPSTTLGGKPVWTGRAIVEHIEQRLGEKAQEQKRARRL